MGYQPKNSGTWNSKFRHGHAPTLEGLENYTFEDDPWGDGTALKDTTFDSAALSDVILTPMTKNSGSWTPTPKS